ncbi:hypothetical protein PR048_024233 [Dryococelus australis]|uniref:THAP-type domain-containing protein n=1 Tax=Dryococelus australis TaxID=614101 RepID=A0ABQ9GN07_9NEOP|nr:hypothetical protein PR048_024233 [Dryococelus australis]
MAERYAVGSMAERYKTVWSMAERYKAVGSMAERYKVVGSMAERYKAVGSMVERYKVCWEHGGEIKIRYKMVRLLVSHQNESGSIPGRVTPDCRKWESSRTIPLVGGFSRRSPVSPPLHSDAAPFSPHYTLIGSQDLVMIHQNLSRLNYRNNAECLERAQLSMDPPPDVSMSRDGRREVEEVWDTKWRAQRHHNVLVQFCAVPHCKSSIFTQGIAFYAFPRDPERFKQWKAKVRRDERFSPVTPYMRACSKHFVQTDYRMVPSGGKFLNKDAVPIETRRYGDCVAARPRSRSEGAICTSKVKKRGGDMHVQGQEARGRYARPRSRSEGAICTSKVKKRGGDMHVQGQEARGRYARPRSRSERAICTSKVKKRGGDMHVQGQEARERYARPRSRSEGAICASKVKKRGGDMHVQGQEARGRYARPRSRSEGAICTSKV